MKNSPKTKYVDAPSKFNPAIEGYVPDVDKIKKIKKSTSKKRKK